MIKVSVFYPSGEGKHFDMKYYCERHIPLLQKICGDSLKSVAVDEGISGMAPDSPAPYAAMGHLVFDSLAAYEASLVPHLGAIVGDVPNYTNIQPVIQFSEVKL